MPWLQALDVSLFRLVNHSLSNPLFDVVMPWLSGNRLFAPMLLLLAAILIWRGRGKGLLFILVLGLAIGVTDGLVCNTLKHAFSRPRPCLVLENVIALVGCSDSGSLPSSHAANWFAAAMVAFLFHRRSWRAMLPLALAVSFSRVYNGVHYPSDVVAGAILGSGTGFAVVFGLNATWGFVGRKWFPLWHKQLPSLLVTPPGPPPASAAVSALQTPHDELNQHWLRAGYLLVVALTIARWVYLASGTIELSEDEAYQWVWSKHLALSYYSKPLLIACTQWLGTTLWGDTAFGVRFFSPLIAATLGILLLRFFAREVNARAGFFLVLIVTATPLLAVGATLLTVDPLAVLFWTAAMLSGWRAVQESSRTSAWLWAGLWMGLGFLSKYTSPLQWMCWAVFFALWPTARQHLRRPGPYLGLLINLLCTLPVLIWNWLHDWITVKHVASHGGAGNAAEPLAKHISWLLEFLGAEFVLLNPYFFVAALIALMGLWRMPRRDAHMVYFFSMGAPVFLLYVLLSLNSRVQANWIAPSVLPMLCVMVLYWDARRQDKSSLIKLWLASGLTFGLTLVVIIHDTNLVGKIAGRPLPPQVDPLRRVRGHAEMARVVGQARARLAQEGKPVFIIADHYGITSVLTFYSPEAREHVQDSPLVFCQPTGKPENQYYFWPGYTKTHTGQNALFVRELGLPKLVPGWFLKWLKGAPDLTQPPAANDPAPAWLVRDFESVNSTGSHDVLYRGRVLHKVEIFECRNLR
jgi:membrane-associated phospholipid phosphatase